MYLLIYRLAVKNFIKQETHLVKDLLLLGLEQKYRWEDKILFLLLESINQKDSLISIK
jgi:hypothetical protein